MAGNCPGKTKIEDVDVFIHEPVDDASDADGTTNIHIDIEHELLSQIIDSGESTFVGGKQSGVFIGLKTEQADRAEAVAEAIRSNTDAPDNP